MSETQPHLRIAHEIGEQLMVSYFTERQRRVLDLILRLSWGCGQERAYIPQQQCFEMVGVGAGHVKGIIDVLTRDKVITRDGCFYTFNRNTDQWCVSRAPEYTATKLTELEAAFTYAQEQLVTFNASKTYRIGNSDLPKREAKVTESVSPTAKVTESVSPKVTESVSPTAKVTESVSPKVTESVSPTAKVTESVSPEDPPLNVPLSLQPSPPLIPPAHLVKEKESKEREKVKEIYEFWNSQKVVVHRLLTEDIRKSIRTKLRDYPADDVCQAIANYSEIVLSPGYWWNHKWTLKDFLARGLEKFLDGDIAKQNYRGQHAGKSRLSREYEDPDTYNKKMA
jgi:hypothetical protein